MNGSLYTWSSINSYFASYLHHHGQDITVEDLYFLMPCIFLVQYCFMTIGVKIGDSCGPRVTTIIGVFFMIGSYAFLIFFTNYYLVLLGMGLFGFGDGIANLSVINNGWKYFKNNKGLVNGIIIGGLGLSSSVLNPLADFMINPEKKGTESDGFYSKQIADRLLNFLYVLVGIFIVLGTMAIALTIPYEEEIIPAPTEGLIQNDTGDNSTLPPPPETSTTISKSPDTTVVHHEKKRVAFFSIVNFQLGIFCFCGPCKNSYITFSFLFPSIKYKQSLW